MTRRASAAERAQAREVARFVAAIDEPGDTLCALVLISKFFPDIKLETALAGWVFRTLLASQARVLQ
jgi:hypothetical protein